jgi:uridine kinase
LNNAIAEGRAAQVVLVSEALHEQHIAAIAGDITALRDQVRLVLIAGPSASGKTTFAKRLSVQLLARGIRPLPLELDSFFVDREATPLDETGAYDFETLEALDLGRLNHDLQELIAGRTVRLPRYDFKRGRQEDGDESRLEAGQMLLLEGIHGLNPALTPGLAPHQTFRIYASALTQLNLDRYNRVSTTDTRLLRRIVRDASQRGYSANETIQRWESVRRGEKRHIFPYQENADVMFNSALVYEVSALAPLVEPLLRQVAFGTPEHVEAKRLLAFLEWFLPCLRSSCQTTRFCSSLVGRSSNASHPGRRSPPRADGGVERSGSDPSGSKSGGATAEVLRKTSHASTPKSWNAPGRGRRRNDGVRHRADGALGRASRHLARALPRDLGPRRRLSPQTPPEGRQASGPR